jgi:hypothetical protein
MSLTTGQKATKEYKKGLGVADTNTDKNYFEEPQGGRIVYSSKIWAQDNLIPNTAPTLADQEISGVVQRWIDLDLVAVPGSPDAFYNENLKDAIPFNWGDGSYVHTIKDFLGNTLPAGYNDVEVDNAAGILRFYSGAPANVPPKISFFKYVGTKGGGGGGSFNQYEQAFNTSSHIVVEHNLGRIPNVNTYDGNGVEIFGAVVLDVSDPTNKLVVDFNVALTGIIICK